MLSTPGGIVFLTETRTNDSALAGLFISETAPPARAGTLQPPLLDTDDTVPAPSIAAYGVLLPALLADVEVCFAPSIVAESPGHDVQHLRPNPVAPNDFFLLPAVARVGCRTSCRRR